MVVFLVNFLYVGVYVQEVPSINCVSHPKKSNEKISAIEDQ